jgi:hypothetical protein
MLYNGLCEDVNMLALSRCKGTGVCIQAPGVCRTAINIYSNDILEGDRWLCSVLA